MEFEQSEVSSCRLRVPSHREVLDEIDPEDPMAQEMILEHFIHEAVLMEQPPTHIPSLNLILSTLSPAWHWILYFCLLRGLFPSQMLP